MTTTAEWVAHDTLQTVDVAGVEVAYHDIGSGDPVLLLHAYGPGSTAWRTFHNTVPALSDRHRCILMELPNFGHTGPVVFTEQGHRAMARMAAGLLDVLEIDRASLLGTSLGGTVALTFACEWPERVGRLVVGSCATGGDPYVIAPFPSEGMRAFMDAVTSPGRESFARYLRAHLHADELVTEELVDELLAHHTAHLDHFEALMQSPQVPHSCVPDLPKITAPTLVVHGRFDRMVSIEHALAIVSGIADSRLVLLGQCGHWPAYEKADEYNAQVRSFLGAG